MNSVARNYKNKENVVDVPGGWHDIQLTHRHSSDSGRVLAEIRLLLVHTFHRAYQDTRIYQRGKQVVLSSGCMAYSCKQMLLPQMCWGPMLMHCVRAARSSHVSEYEVSLICPHFSVGRVERPGVCAQCTPWYLCPPHVYPILSEQNNLKYNNSRWGGQCYY